VRSVAWDQSFFVANAKLSALSRWGSRRLKDYGYSVVKLADELVGAGDDHRA
jgi:hypothetical protein